jgi:hypothetical protein
MKQRTVFFLLVLVCACPMYGGSLSKSIEFDRLLMHARNAAFQGDYRTAADSYAHAAKLNVGPPETFYLDYAGVLGALGRWKDAKGILQNYFQHFDKMGTYYDLALRRYVDAEDKVEHHSDERVRPDPIGPVARAATAPGALKWTKNVSSLPPVRPNQLDNPATPGRIPLERLIGLYSGEVKDSDNAGRSSTCEKTFSPNKPHPSSDCFSGYHRTMSLNAVDGSALVGFVKVEYTREHRPASSGDQRDRKLTLYTRMEYYLAIRLWITPNGLIQGQQKPLCEFMVEEQVCMPAERNVATPLRAWLTPEGALGLESEKGGGPRLYTRVRAIPDAIRAEVARAVPSLGAFVAAPANRQEKPSAGQAKPSSIGDTAGLNDEDDDSTVPPGVSTAARQLLEADRVG